MQKIPTLFVRDPADMSRVTRNVDPSCQWVLDGEGIPTRKRDGSNVRVTIKDEFRGTDFQSIFYEKRRNVSKEERAQGLEPGYVNVDFNSPSDKWLVEALKGSMADMQSWPIGQHPCEALGEKIQGGVEGTDYRLYPFLLKPEIITEPQWFTNVIWLTADAAYDSIQKYLAIEFIEGVVWHHKDGSGRMAKIKRRDFGFKWPVR